MITDLTAPAAIKASPASRIGRTTRMTGVVTKVDNNGYEVMFRSPLPLAAGIGRLEAGGYYARAGRAEKSQVPAFGDRVSCSLSRKRGVTVAAVLSN